MPRVVAPHTLATRLPARRSLAHIGVPDDRDALAVYIRWVRQRYYRAHAKKGAVTAALPDLGGDRVHRGIIQPLSPYPEVKFDLTRFSEDVCGVGARFDGEQMQYASEIDLVG